MEPVEESKSEGEIESPTEKIFANETVSSESQSQSSPVGALSLRSSITSDLKQVSGSSPTELVATRAGVDVENRQIYRLTSYKNLKCGDKCCHPWLKKNVQAIMYGRLSSLLKSYIHWTFRTSFMCLFTSFIFVYLAFSVFFALLIWCVGSAFEDCIDPTFVGKGSKTRLHQSFHLSWTTFSTVGYGMIAPATRGSDAFGVDGEQHFLDSYRCAHISFVCSFESFVGILFAGFCGAIMVGKIARIHSVAPVLFSSNLLIRYDNDNEGNNMKEHLDGIMEGPNEDEDDDNDCDEDDEENLRSILDGASKRERMRCPVIEFRLVNRLANMGEGNEIHDASIIATAKLRGEKNDVDDATTQIDNKRFSRTKRMIGSKAWFSTKLQTIVSSPPPSSSSNDSLTMIFRKVDFWPSSHPLFQRVWRLQHYLDQDSPLLKKEVREKVRANNGFWPSNMKNVKDIRSSLNFEQILLNFCGTSVICSGSVNTHHIYEKEDVLVGYQFTNIMYRNHNDEVLVDLQKVDDVKLQKHEKVPPQPQDSQE